MYTSYLHFPPPPRLRHHDGRLHYLHQRLHLHRQLPAHQPPHCLRPAQPTQLLRGRGEGWREGGRLTSQQDELLLSFFCFCFSRNTSRFWRKKITVKKKNNCKKSNKKTNLTVFFALQRFLFWRSGGIGEFGVGGGGSPPSCGLEGSWRGSCGGRGFKPGTFKRRKPVVFLLFSSVCFVWKKSCFFFHSVPIMQHTFKVM